MDSCLLTKAPGRYSLSQFDCRQAKRFPKKFRVQLFEKNANCLSMVNVASSGTQSERFSQRIYVGWLSKKRLTGVPGAFVNLTGTMATDPSQRVTSLARDGPLQAEQDCQGDIVNEASNANFSAYFGHPTEKPELAAIRADVIRSKLIRKLSEANQHNRHIQRQLQEKEEALLTCKNELLIMGIELKALIALAQEVARAGIQPGTRKINGKYIQSHLALKLEGLHKRFLLQVQDLDTICCREVPVVWYGMAEDVKVMGSFDGWSQGEQMSPEGTGSFTKFSTTLKLQPGRYEIKFLVDGEWHVSEEWPSVGEGLTANNVLLVH